MSAQLIHSDADWALACLVNVTLTIFAGQLQVHHIQLLVKLRNETGLLRGASA